jgi:cob(I)alamin adenosyltransferase
MKGYIHVYTGDGKGKTTAAVGVVMRAVAKNMSVYFGQFMKLNRSSEHIIFADYPELITLEQFGTGKFVNGKPSAEDYEKAAYGWNSCIEAINSGRYDLVVMDELNLALNLELVPIDDVLDVLASKPKQLEVIITGRYAKKEIIDAADLVTEMKEIKHYYKKGQPARLGIEE